MGQGFDLLGAVLQRCESPLRTYAGPINRRKALERRDTREVTAAGWYSTLAGATAVPMTTPVDGSMRPAKISLPHPAMRVCAASLFCSVGKRPGFATLCDLVSF